MNFKLKFTKWDTIAIAILAITSLILSFFIYFLPKDDGSSVSIYVAGKNEITLNLSSTKTQTIKLFEGDYSPIKKINENETESTYYGYFTYIEEEMTILIENDKIKVEESKCPAQVCVNQGWVSIPNVPITCTHNHVVVVIENSEAPEIDIIL